jgi:hypothetical protein
MALGCNPNTIRAYYHGFDKTKVADDVFDQLQNRKPKESPKHPGAISQGP